jgi:hypothetical protein
MRIWSSGKKIIKKIKTNKILIAPESIKLVKPTNLTLNPKFASILKISLLKEVAQPLISTHLFLQLSSIENLKEESQYNSPH